MRVPILILVPCWLSACGGGGGSISTGTTTATGGIGSPSGSSSTTSTTSATANNSTGTASSTGTTPSASASTSATTGTGTTTGGVAFMDGGVTLDVPATDGSVPIAFDVAISASGADGLSASLANGVGTLTPPGGTALPAFIYERQPWPQYGYTLYQTLAVGPTDWHIGWFYCTDGGLTYLDYEATDNATLQTLDVTGSCAETPTSVDESVSLPASALALDGLVQGFTVTGPSLNLSGNQLGDIVLDGGANWSVFPFALVDCSTSCGTPGWYELHSIYWNAAATQTCFGIFYLIVGSPSSVELEYSICLPDLGDPTDGYAGFDSTWSGS